MIKMIQKITEWFVGLLQPTGYKPPKAMIFSGANYHPLAGLGKKVDRPAIPIRTAIPSQIPWVSTHLQGDIRAHLVLHPAYKIAYNVRKAKSYFNESQVGQIDKNRTVLRPWQEKRGSFMGNQKTQTVSSRNPKDTFVSNFFEKATNPQ